MGKISNPPPVKLISGLIFKETKDFERCKKTLKKIFGDIDFESKLLPFDLTDYYKEEFGTGLSRKFISFKKLIRPERLAGIKATTNKIETRFSLKQRRLVNIDPGYVDMAKLVLASTKDFSHRIYLNKGIFAEITLSFQEKSFRPREYTYPDYRTEDYIAIFNRIREIYAGQIK